MSPADWIVATTLALIAPLVIDGDLHLLDTRRPDRSPGVAALRELAVVTEGPGGIPQLVVI